MGEKKADQLKGAHPKGQHADDETDRRFNETLRRMLNTPPKPHKDKVDTSPERKGRRGKGHEQGKGGD